ncbi:helix-turn-helix domain-containing protein [Mediterraneibacter gnavus]|uniref:helix-turn-helix domain-containing protein n=1 Tax=Mediterraneibacter gnavus TaxID=33038 RepID=UPI003569BB56
MSFKNDLSFFQNILKNMQVNASIVSEPFENIPVFDFGIRNIAFPDSNYDIYTRDFCRTCKSNILYRAYDEYHFNYIFMLLPNQEIPSYLIIGPYTLKPFTDEEILDKAHHFAIPVDQFWRFKNCYARVPLVSDSSIFFTIINSFAERLWGSMDNYVLKDLVSLGEPSNSIMLSSDDYFSDELSNAMVLLEEKYAAENELMQIISHGQLHKIEMYFNQIDFRSEEQRLADPVRNAKNYAIILNTLLRKATEEGGVHPIHIDKISSAFAKKIEMQTSEKGVSILFKEMARKYALTVKNHSLKGYSKLVRRVMIQVDTDLASDLSLSAQASLLGVNPNYLSTVFKKETGHTLTEYVTGKRIEHAVFLLNSTNMQIQTIAQYCGIPDICYFTKIFKKVVGKTPTEYKNSIRH